MSRVFLELPADVEARLGAALLGAVAPAPPPQDGLAALLASVANPWQRFVAQLATLADVPVEVAGRILDRAEAGSGWTPGLMPTMKLWHIQGGPATAGADVGLVQLAPNAVHPPHEHLGAEEVLVLAGEYLDSAGYGLGEGESERRGVGEGHAFTAGPRGVTLAVVLREGIAIANPAGGDPIIYRG